MATVSAGLASIDEWYESFIRFSKELSRKNLSLALAYFASATLHKALLDAKFCTDLLAPRIRVLSGEVQDFDSYRTELYKAVFALFEKVKLAGTAANRTLCHILRTYSPIPGPEKTVTIQKTIAVTLETFHCSRKNNKKPDKISATLSLLAHHHFQRKALRKHSRAFLLLSFSIFTLFLFSFSGGAPLPRYANFRRRIAALSWKYPATTTSRLERSVG